jgi:5-methylcytosine-specific restriction endonuclease McrA
MRAEFSAKTKVEAFALAKGRCQNCTARLSVGNTQYDHIIPCGLDSDGGDNSLGNCSCLCRNCHREKTSGADVPRIAKAKRNYKTTAGVRKPRTIVSWRKFSGEPVRASRQR